VELGDELNFYHLESTTQIDKTFRLANRLSIPAGRFDNSETGVSLSTSANRRAAGAATFSHKAYYGGLLNSVNASLIIPFGARGDIRYSQALEIARIRSGSLVSNVSGVSASCSFSTRAALALITQRNGLDNTRQTNVRLTCLYRPRSEVFLVLNQDSGRSLPAHSGQYLAKVTYLAQF
jgi:hypothetical protein